MARQNIDTTTPNGAYMGDPAKVAFNKTNANFVELYDTTGSLSTGKVSKGANGTWPDVIPTAWNLWEGSRVIQAFGSGVANAPVTFGVAIAWANTPPDAAGQFTKANGRWINQIAFGTNNDVYFSQSINGNQFGAWRQFWHSGNTTVDANNFIKRA